ncbi:RTA1-domain-containing protein [Zopfia rhizophila CBS 207.26]|uniref:RTA1-domain-containing protein n=1 Tax=Zopfia rhizophila CBS 207.26 TaxID=1314779 RepID=A0A6A6E8P0_9PEZI|nr:RTA1-domain-containing protein [Zopfia rhizophila CBS 207.26]
MHIHWRAVFIPHASSDTDPYHYEPNVPVAITAAVLFTLVSLILIYQYFRYRSWFFWTMIIGVLMEAVGYIARIPSAQNTHKDTPFLISFLLILLGPSFLAAACYTTFSRILWFSCPESSLNLRTLWIPPHFVTPIFVTLDLISFLIQTIGAGQISRSYDRNPDQGTINETEQRVVTGRIILVFGLILQASCFALFEIVAGRYFWMNRKWREEDLGDGKIWRRLNYAINGAGTLITLRAIYRVVEIPHDKNGGPVYLQRHEWCFWAFDALPIFATLILFALYHPGRYLPRTYTRLALNKATVIQQKAEITSPYTVPHYANQNRGADMPLRDLEPGMDGGGRELRPGSVHDRDEISRVEWLGNPKAANMRMA